ncbi:MAG: hypothetical protein LQ338_006677, partial [Usnochroma carphineum]
QTQASWMEGSVLLQPKEEAYKSECAALDRICDALRKGMTSDCLNFLVEDAGDEPTIWQLRPQLRQSTFLESVPAVSLQSLLYNSHHLPLIAKRKLAVILARSLLQLHEGLWLGKEWSKRHITFFYADANTIDYQRPYVTACLDGDGQVVPDFSPFHRNASILALGILLIEIHTGKPIETYRTPKDLSNGTEVNANTDWTVADLVVKALDDCSLGYKDAIQACLDISWVPAGQRVSLDDELTRDGLCNDVVQPLEDEVEHLFRERRKAHPRKSPLANNEWRAEPLSEAPIQCRLPLSARDMKEIIRKGSKAVNWTLEIAANNEKIDCQRIMGDRLVSNSPRGSLASDSEVGICCLACSLLLNKLDSIPEQFRDNVALLLAKKSSLDNGDDAEDFAAFRAESKAYAKRVRAFIATTSLDTSAYENTGSFAFIHWGKTIYGLVAPNIRLLLLGVLLILPVIHRVARMLDYNRYASDQILHTQAIQLEAAHASVPLLFAHILPTLGLVSLLDIVHDASRLTAQAVTLEYFECPMTWEQSMSLGPSLALLADSVGKLDKLVEEELQPNMDSFAWRLPRLSWRPVQLLDQAILKTSNRSHGLESLICANELFPLLNNLATPRGINTLGLLPLEGYSVSLDECIGSVWPSIERTVSLLLMVHDHYNGVFEKGDELGLSRCRASLEQSLSRGKKRPWHVEENVGFIARLVQRLKTTPPVLFTTTSKQQASIPITIHTALFNYWSMLTLLHNLRHDNVLLYTSANAYLPPVIFRRKELNKTSIFDNPPFRQPSGSKRRQPLQVSEQDDHTLNTLAQSLRDRGISMDPPEEWTWTHPSINNKLLHSLLAARVPYFIPFSPGGLNSTVSSNPVSCTPSSSSLSTSPSSSTQRKRLSLHSFRDLFVHQGNTMTDLGHMYRDHSAFVHGEWRADRQRMREYNDAAKRKAGLRRHPAEDYF